MGPRGARDGATRRDTVAEVRVGSWHRAGADLQHERRAAPQESETAGTGIHGVESRVERERSQVAMRLEEERSEREKVKCCDCDRTRQVMRGAAEWESETGAQWGAEIIETRFQSLKFKLDPLCNGDGAPGISTQKLGTGPLRSSARYDVQQPAGFFDKNDNYSSLLRSL